jgi:hypothetical protein
MGGMRWGRGVVAAVGLGMAIALVPSTPAWACSCAGPDPATLITLEITDSAVADAPNPWGAEDSELRSTVDLRGEATSVIGAVPALLDGQELDTVPVLASVLEDPEMQDSCGTPQRPSAGSDLELTGVVSDEGDGTFIFTGACSGSLTVLAGPDPAFVSSGPGRSPWMTAAVVAGGALVVALVAGGVFWRPKRDG